MKQLLLCVDDEWVVLEGLRSQLKRYLPKTIQLELAESAEDALEILEEYDPGEKDFPMIITDYIMPGMKGDELLIQIHQKYPSTVKILLTGQADAESVGNALNRGGLYRYIAKPWEDQDLMMTIKSGLENFQNHWKMDDQKLIIQQDMETFFRFVPEQFLNWMGIENQKYREIQLGMNVKLDLAVMFLDIRSFTTLCELMPNADVFPFLGEFFSQIGVGISANGGLIDKYLGDAVLALFPDSNSAVKASLQILDILKQINLERNNSGKMQIELGMGIHSGELMLGTMGSENRLQTTVLGDCVNVASRLEELTKEYQSPVLISSEVHSELEDSQRFSKTGSAKIRGRFSEVEIFALSP